MKDLIIQVFVAYIITAVIVRGNIFYKFREWIKPKTKWLVRGGRHPIDCRMCTGVWISLAVALAYSAPLNTLFIFGASYFLATQER